jgi:ABC-type sugar transport system ATPase subunit
MVAAFPLGQKEDGVPGSAGGAAPLLEVRDITKHFGAIQALRNVSLAVRPGEIHGLVGANGAGKSTLIKILAGVETADSGEILIDGQPVIIGEPQRASALGLSVIHQELNLVPQFTGFQNMALGLPMSGRTGLVDWRRLRSEVAKAAKRLDIQFPLDVPVSKLTVAEKWLIMIGRSLVRDARLIAMDEPTGSLSLEEGERLFKIIRELTASGVAVLYVSHRLDEITTLCDRVTVFKDGQCVADMERATLSRASLVRAIVGSDLVVAPAHTGVLSDAPVMLEVEGLSRKPAVKDVSFRLRRGEVLGLAGLVGSGRTETARIIFGADKPESGHMTLNGKRYAPSGTWQAVRDGVALVPEERRSQGLILAQSIKFNVNLASWRTTRRRYLPLVDFAQAQRAALNAISSLQINARGVDQRVGRLSGGNQQKVVIAKWLVRHPKVLLLDEPTRGVDVGARAEIYRIIRSLAAEGVAVLVISSEFAELAACDRVLVMNEGRVVGELVGEHISEEAILHKCYTSEAGPN